MNFKKWWKDGSSNPNLKTGSSNPNQSSSSNFPNFFSSLQVKMSGWGKGGDGGAVRRWRWCCGFRCWWCEVMVLMLCAVRGGEGGGWQRWCYRGGGGAVLYGTISPQPLKSHSSMLTSMLKTAKNVFQILLLLPLKRSPQPVFASSFSTFNLLPLCICRSRLFC